MLDLINALLCSMLFLALMVLSLMRNRLGIGPITLLGVATMAVGLFGLCYFSVQLSQSDPSIDALHLTRSLNLVLVGLAVVCATYACRRLRAKHRMRRAADVVGQQRAPAPAGGR